MKKALALVAAVIVSVLSIETGQAKSSSQLTNATVLIIRHAETPEIGKHLSSAGVRRAHAYVGYFESLRVASRPVKIDHLFAARESKNSDRPRETLLPLSNSLRKKIHTNFDLSESQELFEKVRRSYSGQTVLICWHHGEIPDLLKTLGADPRALLPKGKWPDDVFGWLVVLQYDKLGHVFARVLNEKIAPDDINDPPPSS